ncbi:hypothetical protein HDE80_001510 [Rhodanobacter sp. A1T4]|nr:hypothetical protein [Rhodanobacter sp. A1T4]MBB6246473.1 hypothetical protein [Rhodanobacter sp. A1T4]
MNRGLEEQAGPLATIEALVVEFAALYLALAKSVKTQPMDSLLGEGAIGHHQQPVLFHFRACPSDRQHGVDTEP